MRIGVNSVKRNGIESKQRKSKKVANIIIIQSGIGGLLKQKRKGKTIKLIKKGIKLIKREAGNEQIQQRGKGK